MGAGGGGGGWRVGGTGLADLKVSLVVVLVLEDGLGHLEDDVAVEVALGLGEDEDGDGAGGVDEQPQHDEHPVDHVTAGLLRPLAGLSQGGLVAVLHATDDDAHHQTCSQTRTVKHLTPGRCHSFRSDAVPMVCTIRPVHRHVQ